MVMTAGDLIMYTPFLFDLLLLQNLWLCLYVVAYNEYVNMIPNMVSHKELSKTYCSVDENL